MKNLSKLFEKTSKILETGLPLSYATQFLHRYQEKDWAHYWTPYPQKKYFNNCVEENIYLSMNIISWEPGHSTQFHSNTRNSIFKIMCGEITESYIVNSLSVTHVLDTDQVFYRPKYSGIHKLFCPDMSMGCVSIHLYDKRMK